MAKMEGASSLREGRRYVSHADDHSDSEYLLDKQEHSSSDQTENHNPVVSDPRHSSVFKPVHTLYSYGDGALSAPQLKARRTRRSYCFTVFKILILSTLSFA